MSNQEHHELYELLMTYLKAVQSLTTSQKHLEALKNKYHTHQLLLWHTDMRQITSTVCACTCTSVSSYDYAKFSVSLKKNFVNSDLTPTCAVVNLLHETCALGREIGLFLFIVSVQIRAAGWIQVINA